MDNNKILFISQEISPYLPETPLSVMGRDLPQAVMEHGCEVRTFMPKYGYINERRNQLHEVIRLSGMNLAIDDTDHPLIIKVATLQPSRMQVYFIFNEDYFTRNITKELETVTGQRENDERSMFFVRGVFETVKKLRWTPNVIHCSGWITALAPLYARRVYNDDPTFNEAKIVYGLFDDDFEMPFPERFAKKLKYDGFRDRDLKEIAGQEVTSLMLTKLAIEHADGIIQCVPTIKPEVKELVEQSGKPFLPYSDADEDYAKKVLDFYNLL